MKMCLQVKSERSKVNILLLLTIYHIQTSGLGTQYPLEAAGESLPYGVHLLLTDTDIGEKKTEALGITVCDTVERDFRREGTV